jgi:hypothetical protein
MTVHPASLPRSAPRSVALEGRVPCRLFAAMLTQEVGS